MELQSLFLPKGSSIIILHMYPRGSKDLNDEYLAQTILTLPCVEAQGPRYIGTSTLRVYVYIYIYIYPMMCVCVYIYIL